MRADSWWNEQPCRRLPGTVGLNTGAGDRWQFKRWGERETSALSAALHDRFGVGVIVCGGPAEAERNRRIVAGAARGGVVAAPTDLGLLEFAALIERCSLLVTSDTLALHLAIAAATPLVAFFGPTSAAEVDLLAGPGEKVVTPLECRCCYLATCDKRPHCMTAIPVQAMLEAAGRWLPAPAASA
jgi:heptosyltransferase-2